MCFIEHHSLFRNKVVPFGPVSWLRNFASVHLLDADEEDTTCPMDQYFGMHSRLKAGVQVEFRIPAWAFLYIPHLFPRACGIVSYTLTMLSLAVWTA